MRARKWKRNNEIFEMWVSGKSQKEIAAEFNLSRGRVCKILDYYRYHYPKQEEKPC